MLLKKWPVLALLLCGLAGATQAGALEIGDEFPHWNLVDQNGSTITSMHYTGRSYVVWFYPAAMTPGCTAEGRSFRNNLAALEQASVEVLGVSFDPPEINALFASTEGFTFPLLTDGERDLAQRVGAVESATDAQPRRITFLVGNDGRVVKIYEHVDTTRHAQEILLDLGMLAP